jgi:hypothetical protein
MFISFVFIVQIYKTFLSVENTLIKKSLNFCHFNHFWLFFELKPSKNTQF